MRPEFSIIIPVYNSEKYLETCVNSVLNQKSSNFEVLLIDDCSSDNSREICSRLAREDKRIRTIFHAKNVGAGEARNTGLRHAKGEWIIFVDSDDWLEWEALSVLSTAAKEQPDIIVFGLIQQMENSKGEVVAGKTYIINSKTAYSPQEVGELFCRLTEKNCFGFAANKMFNGAFLKQIHAQFKNIKMTEDFFFNLNAFSYAKKVAVIDTVIYNYRKPAGETLASSYYERFFEISKEKYNAEREYLFNMGVDTALNREIIYTAHFKHIISSILRFSAKNTPLTRKEARRKVKDILTDAHTHSFWNEYTPSPLIFRVTKQIYKSNLVFPSVLLSKLGGSFFKR